MAKPKRTHEDTSISLSPLTFEEAIAKLAQSPKQTGSEAEASSKTTGDAPASAPSKGRTKQRPSASVS